MTTKRASDGIVKTIAATTTAIDRARGRPRSIAPSGTATSSPMTVGRSASIVCSASSAANISPFASIQVMAGSS